MKANHLPFDKSDTRTSLSPLLNNTLLFLLLSYPAPHPSLQTSKVQVELKQDLNQHQAVTYYAHLLLELNTWVQR